MQGAPLITFGYSTPIKRRFEELASQALLFDGVGVEADVSRPTREFSRIARERLADGPESEFPEIQAWRRTFAKMGLKPTQYRCAAEALLRRLRREQSLPAVHPLVDLCNAISVAFAIPIAIFDTAKVQGHLEVRQAEGTETYETFSGDTETPDVGEVIFADLAGHAHARRWSNRQSGRSVIRPETVSVLIVAEALHGGAAEDLARLRTALEQALRAAWPFGRVIEVSAA
jgi:DNA/RNA-binding domain of Phe-tRNA-synthetase-like protein